MFRSENSWKLFLIGFSITLIISFFILSYLQVRKHVDERGTQEVQQKK